MRYNNDDYDQGVFQMDTRIPNYPVEIELMGIMNDPLIAAEIESIIDEVELMGLDFNDPELMGGLIKWVAGKIKGAIKKRRARRAAAGEQAAIPSLQLTTPQGVGAIGPGGITWTGPQGQTAVPVAPAATGTGAITDMLKNPLVIAGLVGVPLLLFMMKRRAV